ncbi:MULTISPECIES: hypothetical protein [unclassified Paenibacillus]|uniref:hypothetical protein n=1 Tax=unclassified Paenibacillus TaxID=185978 RepID=UPI0024B929F9|nr:MULTISPECIES: hypothetical protein [unclassified Paenibacillus]
MQKKVSTYVTNKVDINGNVIGHAEEDFTISVNYETQETSDFAISPELEKVLIENGTYPNTNSLDK